MLEPRALILRLCCAALLCAPLAAQAEFYRWVDAHGQVRISNIPPQGVASDGSVIARYNPSSIAAQQRQLRARLKARDATLAIDAAAAQSATDLSAEAVGAPSK